MHESSPADPRAERRTIAPLDLSAHVLPFVLENMGEGVVVVDQAGECVISNAAACALAGVDPCCSPADWLNSSGFYLPDGVTPYPADQLPLARALRGERVDSAEVFIRRDPASTGTWAGVTARPFTDRTGNPRGAIAIYRNITKRKAAEAALRTSQHRYGLLFERNLAGILRTALDGRILECNEAFARMLGYDSGTEIVGLSVRDLYCDPAEREALVARLREQGSIAQQEVRFRRKDGGAAWILTNLNLVEAEDHSEPTIVGTSFDITEGRQSREALRESEQRFAAFMRHWPGLAFMKNSEGRYVFYNETAKGLFHIEPQEFLGRTDDEIWPPEYAARYIALDREILRVKKLVESIEPIPHKQGVHQWWIYEFPILDQHGELHFIGCVGIDITERKQLEDQLRQSQKMEAVGRLAGGVAHDFNNLLTVISGYGHMLSRGLPAGSSLHSCVDEVLKAASRAASLTNQLLAFSRRQVIQPKVLDLNALVANMDRMLRRVIGEHIELETVLSPGLGNVKADAGQLEQVIMNLAVNARDAMPEGGRLFIQTANLDIKPSSHARRDVRPGSYVRLTVSDTGKGMDAEMMVHLFEPFYTSKATGQGTGLGLSTVYGIVKQSGGEIVVESQAERGSKFTIYLPRVTDVVEPAATPELQRGTRVGTETILLVEDEAGVRQLVREMLHRLGYKTLEASGALEAVRIFEQHRGSIDLLLTDVIMPQMSGRELATRLTAMRPALKVLYISGYTDDMLAHHGVLESNVFLLPKPFAPDALAKKLREVLESPAARRAEA